MAERQQNYFEVVTSSMDRMKHVENYIRTGIAVTKDLAQDFLEINKDDSAKQLDQLRDTLLQFLKMEADIENFSKTIENTRKQYAIGDLPDDLGRQVTAAFHSLNPPSVETLKSHQQFKDFELTIRELIADPETDEGAGTQVVIQGDDMVMMQEEVIPLDPISKQEITDPVKNTICGHSYQRDTITQYINNRRTRCPMVGCSNKRLQLSNLEDDHVLRNLIEKKNKAAERAKRLM